MFPSKCFYFCVSFLDLRVKIITVRKLHRRVKLKMSCPRWRFVRHNKAFGCEISSLLVTWKLSYPTTFRPNRNSICPYYNTWRQNTTTNLVVNRYGGKVKPFWVARRWKPHLRLVVNNKHQKKHTTRYISNYNTLL